MASVYPDNINDIGSAKKLLVKKEFFQLRDTVSDVKIVENPYYFDDLIKESGNLTYQTQQLFAYYLMNPNTPYYRVMLRYMPGAGKTLTSLTIAMSLIEYYKIKYNIVKDLPNNQTPMVFIVGFSKAVFQLELLRRPELGFISRDEMLEHKRLIAIADKGSERDRSILADFEMRIKKRLTKKGLGGFFKFYGYKEFYNRLFILPENYDIKSESFESDLKEGKIKVDLALIEKFCNSFIICDEFHNVYNAVKTNNYGIALQIVFNIFDNPNYMKDIVKLSDDLIKKISQSALRCVFLTATPINNMPTEIIDLLNLVIPMPKLPNGRKIVKSDLFDNDYQLKDGALKTIAKLSMGYFLFYRNDNPLYYPERIIKGEPLVYGSHKVPYLNFIFCPMSKFHEETYRANIEYTLPPDGYSINDMVFPIPIQNTTDKHTDKQSITDKQSFKWKTGAFTTKIIKQQLFKADQKWLDYHRIEIHDNVPSGDWLKYEYIGEYSTKYKTLIGDVWNNLNKDHGKCIISHEMVQMSGVLIIAEILRRNGVIDENGNPLPDTICSQCGVINSKHKTNNHNYTPARFILFYGDIDINTRNKSLERFNNKNNINGYLYRFFIGSEIINEMIDFNCVQNLWIMTCPDDISTLLQKFGRAIRNFSHKMLSLDKQKVTIKIYLSTYSKRKLTRAKKIGGSKEKPTDNSQLTEDNKQLTNGNTQLTNDNPQLTNDNTQLTNDNMQLTKDNTQLPNDNSQLTSVDSSYSNIDLVNRKKLIDAYDLTYEEVKYIEKMQYYLIIQLIEKALNIASIDGPIHKIEVEKKAQIGLLHYEPEINLPQVVKVDESTFNVFHSDEEINLITMIIKRLFLEQQRIWEYKELLGATRNNSIQVYRNKELFSENNFIIALYNLTRYPGISNFTDTYHVFNQKEDKIDRIFNPYDKYIQVGETNYQITYIEPYYVLLPIIPLKSEENNLGIKSSDLDGLPDIDFDMWYRESDTEIGNIINVTDYVKNITKSYKDIKHIFFNKYKNMAINYIPTSVEVYDYNFHINFVQESIEYIFKILTGQIDKLSEMHDFYFKMLYFYDRLELILYASHIQDAPEYKWYEKYITEANLEVDPYVDSKGEKHKKEKIDRDRYNAFLITSLNKSENYTFNMDRMNKFLEPRIKANRIMKVNANMLPVGHLLLNTTSGTIVPTLYNMGGKKITETQESTDVNISQSTSTTANSVEWVKVPGLYKEQPTIKENNIIVGYYEKIINGIEVKFKIRPPNIDTNKKDMRKIERGNICSTKKKEELEDLCRKLKIAPADNIKEMCNNIKMELIRRELSERKRARHGGKNQLTWFILKI